MTKTDAKLKSAVEMALSVLPHEIGCDDCFDFFAAYAEHVITGEPLPEPLRLVAEHLERCPACMEELHLLLEAVQSDETAG